MAFSVFLTTNCCGYFKEDDSTEDNRRLTKSGIYSLMFDVFALATTAFVASICLMPHSAYFCPPVGYAAAGLGGTILLADLAAWAAQCVKSKK